MIPLIITSLFCSCFLLFPEYGENDAFPAEWSAQQHPGLNKGTALDVLKANNYTYVLLETGKKDQWVAVPRTEIIIGETYYYGQGILMPDFFSKEFNRTFSSVLLLERLFPEPQDIGESPSAETYTATVKTEKIDISITTGAGMVTIARLWEKGDFYSGRVVRIKGKVTKFNSDIMGKNWIHIQDGTEYNGHFDLTATCDCHVSVGEVVILRGTLTLDKDFGYGYKYDILLENAVLSQ